MLIVLDTNVLVSGLLRPFSAAGTILRLVVEGRIHVLYDARILAEYREVLRRPKFGFNSDSVEVLLAQIEADGILITAEPVDAKALPDPTDAPFLEIALAARVPLVTGNKRHFPASVTDETPVLNPSELIEKVFHVSVAFGSLNADDAGHALAKET